MDLTLLRALDGTPPWLAPIALIATYSGDFGGAFLLLGIYLVLFARGPRRRAGAVVLAALLLVLIVVDLVLKPLVHRPRPFQLLGMQVLTGAVPGGFSFPSGHTAAAFAGAVAWIQSAAKSAPGQYLLPLLYAAIVGWSRVYLGAHWPSDVLAGALIGALCGYLAVRLVPRSFLGGAY